MLFSSLVFICMYLPIVFAVNACLGRIHTLGLRAQNFFLLFASLFFYAWGESVYVLLMILAAGVNYIAAILMQKHTQAKKTVLTVTVLLDLGTLGVFKYADFLISALNGITGAGIPLPGITLPIGISFFMFQAMSYTIDVYRQETDAQTDFTKLLLYISFFPQLIAGPIVKYHDIEKQLDSRTITLPTVSTGIRRFIAGLSKKLLLANAMGLVADSVYAMDDSLLNMPLAWLFAFTYLFQIYFDFSGYSDMALGLGSMFGFTFKENFNDPYAADSLQDFWRRWHISLSTWFKEYLYIPLGGNRKGIRRTGLNKLVVFFCTGLWHGANWTFVVWGLYHGFFLMLENLMLENRMLKNEARGVRGFLPVKKWVKPFRHIYLLLVVTVGFVIFRCETLGRAAEFLTAMFTGFSMTTESTAAFLQLLSPSVMLVFAVCILASTPVLKKIVDTKALPDFAYYSFSMVLFMLCMLELSSSAFNPFIYFRF